jgi:hypothetical protein
LKLTEVSATNVINEEREFLHDISTPLMVLRLTLENLKASGAIGAEYEEKYERAMRAIETLSTKVEQRRSHIKGIQAASE